MDGFRASDHERVLACLSDDVTWYLAGYKTLQGKKAFDAEIENPDFVGSPTLRVDRVVEEGDTVVLIGTGQGTHRTNGPFDFAFCDALVVVGDLIDRVESYTRELMAGNEPAAAQCADRYTVRSGACITHKSKDLADVMIERFGDPAGLVDAAPGHARRPAAAE